MTTRRMALLFSVVSAILVLAGITYAFLGLGILPVERDVLQRWTSAIYGAIMMGWGTTLLLVGSIAFRRNDAALLRGLLAGLAVWLIVEALFSAYLRVWFNVGVDVAVLTLFSVPLVWARRSRGAGRS
jgi:hypothetical protein